MLESNEYQQILEAAPNMIWRAGIDGKLNYFNKTWLNFTGRQLEEEVGNGWAEGVHPEDVDRCLQIFFDHFSVRKAYEMIYRLKRYDGKYRWISDKGIPYYARDGTTFLGFIGSCIDITEKIEGQILKELAQIDRVCEVNNRQHAEKLIRRRLEHAKNKEKMALILIHINNLQQVKDKYGCHVCDVVLRKTARVIRNSVRRSDICGRYGEEKFIVGLPETDSRAASEIAERIRQTILLLKIKHGHAFITIAASIGVCQIPDEEFSRIKPYIHQIGEEKAVLQFSHR